MDSSDEENIVLTLFCEEADRLTNQKKRTRVHPIFADGPIHGEFLTLFPQLVRDQTKFSQYFHMTFNKFKVLLKLLERDLTKEHTPLRRSIYPEERLAVCLKYLTTGDSFRAIALSYRLGDTTVREIVYETCTVIWNKLSPIVMPVPDVNEWKSIESVFQNRWNFPNCIGALDGKHVVIEAPGKTGSMYFNYKKTFSIVLMALVDADYRFIVVDVGAYDKNSDGGIFSNSAFGKALIDGNLNVPDDKSPLGSEQPLPYVIVSDEAFPLKRNIMRPYPGAQSREDEMKKIFKYRLSRARRVSENAFGILTQKYRIYQRRIYILKSEKGCPNLVQ